ncbi:MAG: hypothetical protein WA294_14090 [Acidobacteriaceae bacterium]
MHDFTETYRGYSADQLALLSGQIDSLTEAARCALLAEIRVRGLSAEKLSELRTGLAEHAASVDKERQEARRATVLEGLKRLVFRFVAGGIAVLLLYLIHRFWKH